MTAPNAHENAAGEAPPEVSASELRANAPRTQAIEKLGTVGSDLDRIKMD